MNAILVPGECDFCFRRMQFLLLGDAIFATGEWPIRASVPREGSGRPMAKGKSTHSHTQKERTHTHLKERTHTKGENTHTRTKGESTFVTDEFDFSALGNAIFVIGDCDSCY